MKVLVRIYPWESPKLYFSEFDLSLGDKVVVAGDQANEIGIVEGSGIETKEEPAEKILRSATERDKAVFEERQKEKNEFIKVCRAEIKKFQLGMKLVDVA